MPLKNINVAVAGSFRSGKSALVEKMQQRKGMASDIALYSYKTQNANVTLIDVPGEADKLGPLMNAASMADGLLLCVPADKGIDIQAGEALIAFAAACARHAAVAITKTDMVTFDDLEKLKVRLKALLKGTPFTEAPIFETSTLVNTGIPEVA